MQQVDNSFESFINEHGSVYSTELKDMNIEDSINDLYLEAFELKAESQTSPRMAYPQLHEEPLIELVSTKNRI